LKKRGQGYFLHSGERRAPCYCEEKKKKSQREGFEPLREVQRDKARRELPWVFSNKGVSRLGGDAFGWGGKREHRVGKGSTSQDKLVDGVPITESGTTVGSKASRGGGGGGVCWGMDGHKDVE